MILYDKKGNFLGMSQEALSSLGFQDIDEFKSSHDDLADMFVKNPGYISKFKNFSWINYTLHSGTQNRRILIKNKNDKELEATFRVTEIFMMNDSNDEEGLYNIEIDFAADANKTNKNSNFSSNNELNIDLEDSLALNSINIGDIEQNPEELSLEETIGNNTVDSNSFIVDDFDKDSDINLGEENSLETDDINIDLDEKPKQKLKIDFDLDYDGAKVDIKTETEDNSKAKMQETKQQKPVELINEKEIDLTQIAQDAGMGLKDLAEFINDFISESKEAIDFAKAKDGTDDLSLIKDKIIILKGIATHLKVHNIIKTLELIISSTNSDELNHQLDIFEMQIKNLEKAIF